MPNGNGRRGSTVTTYKQEAVASRGMVTSNHPLASTAGVEALTHGGNAVDAAVATLSALSVVEPMMVSPFGAGFFMIRDGRTGDTVFIDDYATVPGSATPEMYDPIPGGLEYRTRDGTNEVVYRAVATPGALKGGAHAVERYGRLPLAELIEPAARFAEGGFAAGEYLVRNISETATRSSRRRRPHPAGRTSSRSSTCSKRSPSGGASWPSGRRATSTSSPRRSRSRSLTAAATWPTPTACTSRSSG